MVAFPDAVSVADPPGQMTDGEADAEMLTALLTNTVTEAVPAQPLVVPVTVYVVVVFGLTVMLAPVCPVLQTKVEAPLAVSVAEPPGQITDGDAEAVTLIPALTFTVADAVAEHPAEFVPVTV